MPGEVPVIDISPYYGGSEDAKRELAAEIDRVCSNIGFMSVTGHGIDPKVIGRAWREIAAVFDLADEEKRRLVSPEGYSNRGYIPLGGEALSYTLDEETPPDMFEAFNIGHPDRCTPAFIPTETEKFFFQPNVWPENSTFQPAVRAYYAAMEKLAADLMRIFALALGLDERHFDRYIDRHFTTLRMLNYPEPLRAPVPGQMRIGPHTDYGSLTILRAEPGKAGLEVRTKSGAWAPVMPREDAFIINIGDLMAFWTNDRWVSTMHRVVVPPEEKWAGSRRQSIAFFHHPNADARISAVETCRNAGKTPEEVSSAGWLMMKLNKQTVEEMRTPA